MTKRRRTLLETALDAVGDGHPPLRDELVQDAGRHGAPQAVQSALPGLRTEVTARGDGYSSDVTRRSEPIVKSLRFHVVMVPRQRVTMTTQTL